MEQATKFQCPTCETQYKVVRAESPAKNDAPVNCLSCGAPFHSRKGKFALKYSRLGSHPTRDYSKRKRLI